MSVFREAVKSDREKREFCFISENINGIHICMNSPKYRLGVCGGGEVVCVYVCVCV